MGENGNLDGSAPGSNPGRRARNQVHSPLRSLTLRVFGACCAMLVSGQHENPGRVYSTSIRGGCGEPAINHATAEVQRTRLIEEACGTHSPRLQTSRVLVLSVRRLNTPSCRRAPAPTGLRRVLARTACHVRRCAADLLRFPTGPLSGGDEAILIARTKWRQSIDEMNN